MNERKEPTIWAFVITKEEARPQYVKNEHRHFREIIGCDCVNIIERYIGGKRFDFVIDDESALIEGNHITAFAYDVDEEINGNLIICGSGAQDGEEHSLTAEDVKDISECLINGGLFQSASKKRKARLSALMLLYETNQTKGEN